jgi:hypothetical protein
MHSPCVLQEVSQPSSLQLGTEFEKLEKNVGPKISN